MKKYIGITGANGTLGRCLLNILKNDKDYVLQCFTGDIRKKKDISNWIKSNNFDSVIHLAAIVPTHIVNKNINNAWNVNVLGTANLAEAILLKNKETHLIYASTSHVYQPSKRPCTEKSNLSPQNLYGLSKLHAEQILGYYEKNKNLKLTICRIFSFTSIYQNSTYFIPAVVKKIRTLTDQSAVEFKSLNGYRDFLDGHDVARALVLVTKKDFHGVINICSGKKYSLREIVRFCLIYFKKENIKIIENCPITEHIEILWGNNSKLHKLGYRPQLSEMEQILDNYIQFIVKH
jgi:nucleoside-diphosphate-sugar epimerase